MSTAAPAPVGGEPRPGPASAAVPIPKELESVPPGVALAGILEDIDVELVSGCDTVEVLCAEYRLLCRQQARFLQAVLETGLRRPFSISTVERVGRPGDFASEEARAALVWSRARAERTFAFAVDVHMRLPLLGQAMLAGELDEPRARAFVDWTGGLADEQAHSVCEQLLPTAGSLTVADLIDRVKRACLAIDPGWAEKTYKAAVRTRRVRGFLTPDGTGTLAGYSQPAERVVAACERIDTLARACKRAGDRRAIDLIRSDLYLGMTDGTFEGLAELEIIAYVLAHPYTVAGEERSDPSPGDDGDGDGSGGSNSGRSGGERPGGPGAGGALPGGLTAPGLDDGVCIAGAAGLAPAVGLVSSAEPAPPAEAVGAAGEPARAAAGFALSAEPAPSAELAGTTAEPPAPFPTIRSVEPPSVQGWHMPELRIQLATVLSLNGEPGEVPGWGYVPAWLAKHMVNRMLGAEWRYANCDADGRVLDGGLIMARPVTGEGVPVRRTRQGGIVELSLRPEELVPLAHRSGQPAGTHVVGSMSDVFRAWALVLDELASAVATGRLARDSDTRDATRRTAGRAIAALDSVARSPMRASVLSRAGVEGRPGPPGRFRAGWSDDRDQPFGAMPARPPAQG